LSTPPPLHHLLRGPLHFLRADGDEIRRLAGDARLLPMPQRIYLEDESATPLYGFPILVSDELRSLSRALEEYVNAEEALQVAMIKRQTFDRRVYGSAWERYRALLAKAIENVTISSYGRQHPAVFWLHQSLDVSRLLRETPKRIVRLDLAVGREHGDALKYLVLDKVLDRLFSLTYDVVHHLSENTYEVEDELFPAILTRLRDNVLIFSESHIGSSLNELSSYFAGYLRIDGRSFVQRLLALEEWHAERLRSDGELRDTAAQLLALDAESDPRELLKRPGWVRYLSTRRYYDSSALLPPVMIQVWESLLEKLKEFELFHSLRRMILPLDRRPDGGLVSRRSTAASGSLALQLSSTTRPLDFMTPWVVNPLVERCGMIYDISNYSEIVSRLQRSAAEIQDESFRSMFRFQRWVNRTASLHRLTLEKYLGDGAFYSGRDARRMAVTAVHVQRQYSRLLQEGFPFDRGMRIALNYSQYRLLPIQSGAGGGLERYEFFGHGLVELSRLVTGKATRDIDEIRNLLVGLGYPEPTVNRFFAPLSERNLDLVDKSQESRQFHAYVNPNGTLVNEGIVATAPFVARLSQELRARSLSRATVGNGTYLVLAIEEPGEVMSIGLRKLGTALLKGLERLAVYEVIDAAGLQTRDSDDTGASLHIVLEQEFAGAMSGRPPLG
jgi:hypothetical protein